jgi:hypothetical protein
VARGFCQLCQIGRGVGGGDGGGDAVGLRLAG